MDKSMARAFIKGSLLINWRTTQPEQKPATNNDGVVNRTLSFKGHPFKLRLVNSPQCDRSSTASHVVYECWALATLRLSQLAHHFTNPGDFQDICASKILHIVQSVGLLYTNIRVAQKPNYGQSAWVTTVPALLLFHQVFSG